jgi:hypothetical protein
MIALLAGIITASCSANTAEPTAVGASPSVVQKDGAPHRADSSAVTFTVTNAFIGGIQVYELTNCSQPPLTPDIFDLSAHGGSQTMTQTGPGCFIGSQVTEVQVNPVILEEYNCFIRIEQGAYAGTNFVWAVRGSDTNCTLTQTGPNSATLVFNLKDQTRLR